jgi:hypothetical protein
MVSAAAAAWGQERQLPIVSSTEQAARDDQRINILRVELAAELEAVMKAAQRRAERLIARDAEGAQDAEEAFAVHRRNISDLHKELDQTSRSQTTAVRAASVPRGAVASGAVSPKPEREIRRTGQGADAHGVALAQEGKAWWDVYVDRRVAGSPAGQGDHSTSLVPTLRR